MPELWQQFPESYSMCSSCTGTGRDSCSACGGTGSAIYPPGPCSSCGGTGGPICRRCGGSGSIQAARRPPHGDSGADDDAGDRGLRLIPDDDFPTVDEDDPSQVRAEYRAWLEIAERQRRELLKLLDAWPAGLLSRWLIQDLDLTLPSALQKLETCRFIWDEMHAPSEPYGQLMTLIATCRFVQHYRSLLPKST